MSIFSLTSFANAANPELTAADNAIFVEINSNNQPATILEFHFETSEDLFAFDLESKINEVLSGRSNDNFCLSSISLTVSVGAGKTYASATVTVEDVPCSEIAATVKLLKAQLKEALK